MKFFVVNREERRPIRGRPLGVRPLGPQPHAVLYPDNWNDYGYVTMFSLTLYVANGDVIDAGNVKITRLGLPLGRIDFPSSEFQSLPDGYCSLGQEYTYYEALASAGGSLMREVLWGMRDVVFLPILQQMFAREDSYNKSLLRFDSAVRAIEDAPALLGDYGPSRAPLVFAFSTNVGGGEFVIRFKFADRKHIPSRINAIIGYNGTGKTRLLANLAVAASLDSYDRLRPDIREESGNFDPEKINFGAVVAISYSAFDIFGIPGDDGSRYGYTYCGLRKIDNDGKNVLKSPEELTGDFFGALTRARNGRQKEILIEVFDRLRQEPSFAKVGLVEYIKGDEISIEEIRVQFERLSTGHKIVLNIAAHLAANLQQRSLILIDEPESHLHPPLLAALLRALSEALDQRDSFAILATHSPVVIQEVPGRYVSVLRRSGEQTLVQSPETETFGENVGFLTRTVFNLDSSATDHSAVLHNLAQFSLDDIERMFGNSLSNQARTYIMKLQSERPS